MALPVEINSQRAKGDTYSIAFTVTQDYSAYTIQMVMETATIAASIVTATSITFPGTHLGTLEPGLHPYKVLLSGAATRTLNWGEIQIMDDNLEVTP